MSAPPPTTNSTSSGAGSERAARLLPHHLDHLRASGLDLATIAAVPLSSTTDAEQARTDLGWRSSGDAPPVPALRIGYPGSDYKRFRPDQPRVDVRGRPVKYEAPVGRPPRIYVPTPIRPEIADESTRLWGTEGEKKTLAGCEAGLAMIGAPGINLFHDVAARKAARANGDDLLTLHPDLADIVTAQRHVAIVADSDIDKKPEVAVAVARATRMIAEHGAVAEVSYLPTVAGLEKTGVDDLYVYLQRDGARLRELLHQQLRPADIDGMLDWLAAAWPRWTGEEQGRQLDRALPFVAVADREASVRWIEVAARRLGVSKRDLLPRLKPWLRRRPRDVADAADWMDAPGFFVGMNGVWKEQDGDKDPKPISAAPMNVVGKGTAEDGTRYCTVRFRYGREEQVRTVPREMVMGPDLMRLAAFGAPVTQSNRGAMQVFLHRQEEFHAASIPTTKVYTRCGWTVDGAAYVLGRNVIGAAGRSIVDADERFLDALAPRGDRREYAKLCAEVRSQSAAAEMMWAAGYVGPLLRLLGRRSRLVSTWGPSGRGKSAGQAMAMSPYGRPEGLKLTGDATPTAIEAALARSRDGLVWIDDTQQSRYRAVLDALAYQVGGGTGRARGTATGGLRQIKDWLAVGLVSGEHPLIKLGAAAGARNRTLEIRVEPMDAALAKQVHQVLDQHHGWTGPEFIAGLLNHFVQPQRVRRLDEMLANVLRALEPPADEAADHVALLVMADRLARTMVFGEADLVARECAIRMGSEILHLARTGADSSVDPILAAYETITAWVAENEMCFDKSPLGKRFGVFIEPKDVGGKRVVAIMREPLRELARRAEFDVEEALHGLRDRGLLLPGEGDRLARKTPALGKDRPRAYWIVLGEAEAPNPPSGPPTPPDYPAARPRAGAAEPAAGTPDVPRGSGAEVGPEAGPEYHLSNQEAETDCPAVPVVPAADALYVDDAGSNNDIRAAGHAGTTGTVGTDLGREEGERERRSMISSSSPLPPAPAGAVPDRVPAVSRPGQIGGTAALPELLYEYITDPADLGRVADAVARAGVGGPVALDLETTGLDPLRDRPRLLQLGLPDGRVFIIDLFRTGGLGPLADALRGACVLGHNLQFDVAFLAQHFGIRPAELWDTMVAAKLLGAGADLHTTGVYKLDALCDRRLGIKIPKEQQTSDWSRAELSPEQLEYAARDVAVLRPLHGALAPALTAASLDRVAALEFSLVPAVADMELVGLGVDRSAWTTVLDDRRATAAAAKAEAAAKLGVENVDSPRQILAALKRLGVSATSTSAEALAAYGHVPGVSALAAYRRTAAFVRGAGEAVLAALDRHRDGRVHASLNPLAASTGRFGCGDPNLLALPKEPDVRRAITPRPGNIFVDADYAAIELRVLAQVAPDKALADIFRGGGDPHRTTAAAMLQKSPDLVTRDERARSKPVNFGFCFGMGPARFVAYALADYGVPFTLAEARQFRGVYRRTYPGVARWQAQVRARMPMEVRTASGRLRRFEDRRRGYSERLGAPVQGAAADGLKRALVILDERLRPTGARLVLPIHDEVLVEAAIDRAEEVKTIVENAMVEGMREFVTEVPIVVEADIRRTWAGEESA